MSGNVPPTLAGFSEFVYSTMGIDPLNLPTNSPVIGMAYDISLAIVNTDLAVLAGSLYALAVYNLAGSILLNTAPDQAGRTYFFDLRKSLDLTKWQAGLVSSTSDSSTSTSLLNPEFMQTLTLANLQQLKDPYGRAYLALAQLAGSSIYGIS